MNDITSTNQLDDRTHALKKTAIVVYICQVLTFFLAGIPLLIGIILDFVSREQAKGSWIESHFNWQITTAWIALAGFALSGFTFFWGMGIFIFILSTTLIFLVYRIALGWTALMSNKPIAAR
jgi:uncharacterized membrane protein